MDTFKFSRISCLAFAASLTQGCQGELGAPGEAEESLSFAGTGGNSGRGGHTDRGGQKTSESNGGATSDEEDPSGRSNLEADADADDDGSGAAGGAEEAPDDDGAVSDDDVPLGGAGEEGEPEDIPNVAGLAGTGDDDEPVVGLDVTPSAGRVGFNEKLQFEAIVIGLDDPSVDWAVQEGVEGGQVDQEGIYTAPTVSGVYHVCAVSIAQPTLSDCAAVTVAAPAGTPPTLVPGRWVDLTPPEVDGASCLAVDPSDAKTMYTAANNFGIWKTVDGGTSWAPLAEGPDPDPYDDVCHWLDDASDIAVDPNDSEHLYAVNGVDGANNGFFVSYNGGTTWLRQVPPDHSQDLTALAVDPTDFYHILVGSHVNAPTALLESFDGGDSFTVHPHSGWGVGTPGLAFLYDPLSGEGTPNEWLIISGGYFITRDSGANWTKVSDASEPHGGARAYYSRTSGVWYAPTYSTVLRSEDQGQTWEAVEGLPNSMYYSIIGDGKYLYAVGDRDSATFFSPEADGKRWTQYSDQILKRGPLQAHFDAANRVIYSANWNGGVQALKVLDD